MNRGQDVHANIGASEEGCAYAHAVTLSVGVDIAEARKGLDVVALDDRRTIIERVAHASVDDVFAIIEQIAPDVVCIDSPPAWALTGKSRTAERALRPLGITAFSTPMNPGDHPFYRWMRVGMALFQRVSDHYPSYRKGPIHNTALEVFPEASATLLTGRLCPKGQKIPFRRAVLRAHGIDDSSLPNLDAVDAALAALTGLRALDGQFTAVGDPAEGIIVVPVAPLPAAPLTRAPQNADVPSASGESALRASNANLAGEGRLRSTVESSESLTSNLRLCECGCGAPVSRRFLPGHDAKLKSRLLAAARSGDTLAAERLRQLGWIAADQFVCSPDCDD